MIISASRRTDLPGYYSEWFMNRLKEGYVLTRNPMNHAQVSKLLLTPDTIDCIVFWTKDPANMMDKLDQLNNYGYQYYFQFTLTPYGLLPYGVNPKGFFPYGFTPKGLLPYEIAPHGKDIERNLRDKQDIISTFKQLSNFLGKDKVLWRYDPIILNDEFSMEYHQNMFAILCKELESYTKICTISFVDDYSKLSKGVREQVIKEITEEQMHSLASTFATIAHEHHIEVRACSEAIDLSMDGIKPAACIDKDIIERICGHSMLVKKDKNQRLSCGCIQSVDIGMYNTCKNGCVYCYANHSDTSINNNYLKHDPNSNILIGSVENSEKIILR